MTPESLRLRAERARKLADRLTNPDVRLKIGAQVIVDPEIENLVRDVLAVKAIEWEREAGQ